MSHARRHFTAEQKGAIVRRHLSGKEPVSKLADELGASVATAIRRLPTTRIQTMSSH